MIVLESATKYYQNGADKITAGVVYGPKALLEQIKTLRAVLGVYLQPTCLALLPKDTLDIQAKVMLQHSQNALTLAQWLKPRPQVLEVYYPLLNSHPQYSLAKKMFPRGAGGVLFFSLKGDKEIVEKFCNSLQSCPIGGSFGHPETWVLPLGAFHNNNVIRVAVGYQSVEPVIDDFSQALSSLPVPQ